MPGPANAALIAEMFDRYAAALEFYAAQRTAAAPDCVQEAFLELARQAVPPVDTAAWLFRVVRNRSLNAARAERRRADHEDQAARRQATSRRTTGPEDAAAISDLLCLLSERQREIVFLRIWGQLSWQEVSDVVGRSRSAVHRSYVQALEKLRNHLEPLTCPTSLPTSRT